MMRGCLGCVVDGWAVDIDSWHGWTRDGANPGCQRVYLQHVANVAVGGGVVGTRVAGDGPVYHGVVPGVEHAYDESSDADVLCCRATRARVSKYAWPVPRRGLQPDPQNDWRAETHGPEGFHAERAERQQQSVRGQCHCCEPSGVIPKGNGRDGSRLGYCEGSNDFECAGQDGSGWAASLLRGRVSHGSG